MSNPDTWLQDGPLLYRVTDDRHPVTRDEINVTMADGSRDLGDRTKRASEILALLAPTEAAAMAATVQHSDDMAVDAFAGAMKEKLAQAREKGRGGWETCPPSMLADMLRDHVAKGDPRDVANFCMFLWHLGSSTAPAPQAPVADQLAEPSPSALLAWLEQSDFYVGPEIEVDGSGGTLGYHNYNCGKLRQELAALAAPKGDSNG